MTRLAITREFGALSYAYDAKNQLIQSSFARSHRGRDHDNDIDHDGREDPFADSGLDILERQFQYDAVGNRLADNLRGAATYLNDFLVRNSKTEFTADADGFGNVASRFKARPGLLETFSYRVDKKLATYSSRGLDRGDHDLLGAQYFYDALGRRVAKVITRGDDGDQDHRAFAQSYVYLADQDKILLGRAGTGELTVYLDGLGIDEHLGELGPRGPKTYVTDHLGTVLNGGAVGENPATGSFGESLSPNAEPIAVSSVPVAYGFAGRQFDPESGLYYNRARMYDPSSGRFLSQDPIWPRGGINPFTYANNNPLRYVDPTGRQCLPPGPTWPITLVLLLLELPDMFEFWHEFIQPNVNQPEAPDTGLAPNPFLPNQTVPTDPLNPPNATPVPNTPTLVPLEPSLIGSGDVGVSSVASPGGIDPGRGGP